MKKQIRMWGMSTWGLVTLAGSFPACSSSNGGEGADASVDASVEGGEADGACDPACGEGRTCCGTKCVNTHNDPLNCGECGVTCSGATPFCEGSCKATPCSQDSGACGEGTTCCGTQCCDSTQICCLPEGPLDMGPVCTTPTGSPPTCPQGCAPLCISDRNLKRDIEPVDVRVVLESVARMPVATWSYRSDPAVRHLGPMAQDFYGAFQLGSTDRAYDPIDAHGVAFAAIQGLYEQIKEQGARIERLERDNAELRRRSRRSR
jgi:hypothetical protein